jgi:ankyrin repeat protein
MLALHSQNRGLTEDDIYWVCTFANNQQDLSELGGGLTDTPFVKVILSPVCQGTVVVFDRKLTPFKRIWCVLENQVSTVDAIKMKSEPHAYDMAAIAPEYAWDELGSPVLRLDNGAAGPATEVGRFPHEVVEAGIKIDVTNANASRPEDRRVILHFIAGSSPDRYNDEPPEEHPGYRDLNYNTRKRFASAQLRDRCGKGARGYLEEWEKAPLVDEVREILTLYPETIDGDGSGGATPAFHAAASGFTEVLELLIAARADVHKGIGSTWTPWAGHACITTNTPILEAARQSCLPALQLLIDARVDVNRAPAPIREASDKPDVLSILIKARADVNIANGDPAHPLPSPLDKAIASLENRRAHFPSPCVQQKDIDAGEAAVEMLKAAGAVSANIPPKPYANQFNSPLNSPR